MKTTREERKNLAERSHLLPDPDGEDVRELLDDLEELEAEVRKWTSLATGLAAAVCEASGLEQSDVNISMVLTEANIGLTKALEGNPDA